MCVPWVTCWATWYSNCRMTHVCDIHHSCVRHDSMQVTWFIHVRDMTHLCAWHDSFMCVTSIIHVRDTTHSCVWHDPFMCVTWLVHVCNMTRSCVWHDSFMCVNWLNDSFSCMPWLIHVYDMTHSCLWEDSFMCVNETWLMQRTTWYSNRHTTHSCAWRDSCIIIIFLTWLVHHYHLCDMTYSCVWHDSFVCVPWLTLTTTWLIHVCGVPLSVTCLIHMTWHMFVCTISHTADTMVLPLLHDVMGVTWRIHMCDMTRLCVWHESCSR